MSTVDADSATAARLRGDFLLSQVHAQLAELQQTIRGQSIKVVRAVLRSMRQHEHSPRREDVFIPELGCTLGEFAVLHLLHPYAPPAPLVAPPVAPLRP